MYYALCYVLLLINYKSLKEKMKFKKIRSSNRNEYNYQCLFIDRISKNTYDVRYVFVW